MTTCAQYGCTTRIQRDYLLGRTPTRCGLHRRQRMGKTPPLLVRREVSFDDCPLAKWLDAHRPEGKVSGNNPARKHGIRALWRRMIDEHDGLERLF